VIQQKVCIPSLNSVFNQGWKLGAITNLGRGGSDLTATTIDKALGGTVKVIPQLVPSIFHFLNRCGGCGRCVNMWPKYPPCCQSGPPLDFWRSSWSCVFWCTSTLFTILSTLHLLIKLYVVAIASKWFLMHDIGFSSSINETSKWKWYTR
jgi:hypothetical protein